MSQPSAAEYYDRLSRHDWYHMMSEDYGIVRAGARELSDLRIIAARDPVLRSIFDKWSEYIWHKGERPLRPGGPNLSQFCISPGEV